MWSERLQMTPGSKTQVSSDHWAETVGTWSPPCQHSPVYRDTVNTHHCIVTRDTAQLLSRVTQTRKTSDRV